MNGKSNFLHNKHCICSFYRILKAEYIRTRYNTINKVRFPSLLNQLWTSDPMKTKTNIVKSFMKAGVFPYNPNAIDRSRILKSISSLNSICLNYVALMIDPRNNDETNDEEINQTNNISLINNVEILNDDIHLINNDIHLINNDTSTDNPVLSHQPVVSPFTSSVEAIAALEKILEDTSSTTNSDEDDEDEEYVPPKANLKSFNAVSPMKRNKSQSKTVLTTNGHSSVPSRQNKRRKTSSINIFDFDLSDEDGNTHSHITTPMIWFFSSR